MKKVLNLLIVFVVLLTTGCVKKEALSAETFKEKMESKNYVVVDATEKLSDYSYIDKAYLAIDNELDYQIIFYSTTDKAEAKTLFKKNQRKFDDEVSGVSSSTSLSGLNYEKYTLTANGSYKVIVQVDNTLLFLETSEENKDNAKTILEELGY